MKIRLIVVPWLAVVSFLLMTNSFAAKPSLDLSGYTRPSGEITVLHQGDTIDPYFVTQALLLAYENGMDIDAYRDKWFEWLLPKQKLDGTFDRFCAAGPTWVNCKGADADDALLAMHMRLLETNKNSLAYNPLYGKSYRESATALQRLFDANRGIYLVSAIFQQGLFMDNLEVWWAQTHSTNAQQHAQASALAKSIKKVFAEPDGKGFLVSTQIEQRSEKPVFYPYQVAQLFPLLVNYPDLPSPPTKFYKEWMKVNRGEWLAQLPKDFAWGLIAVIAWKQKDYVSTGCWLRDAAATRNTNHWSLTDEVSYQILMTHNQKPVEASENCK